MVTFYFLILALWALFLTVWAVTYTKIQPNARIPKDENSYVGISIIGALAVLVVFRGRIFGSSSHYYAFMRDHQTLAVGAVALCALGIAFAIWSRVQSTRTEDTLLPLNPGAYVRYPMYVGVLVGMAGSAIVGAIPWLLIAAATTVYFAYRVAYAEGLIPTTPFIKVAYYISIIKKYLKTFIPDGVAATSFFSFKRR